MGVAYIVPAKVEPEKFAKQKVVDSFQYKTAKEIKGIKLELRKIKYQSQRRRYYNVRTKDIKRHVH